MNKFRRWLKKFLRIALVRIEVPPGRILVCWQDVDKEVYGWTMSADDEVNLIGVIEKIEEVKLTKLIKTVEGK